MKELTMLSTELASEEVTKMTVTYMIICMSFADELHIFIQRERRVYPLCEIIFLRSWKKKGMNFPFKNVYTAGAS